MEQRDDQIKFPAPGEVRPLAARKLDLVLLGATGFTGQLAAEHLARQYGNDGRVKWAIAGRRRNALEAIRKKAAELSDDSSASLPRCAPPPLPWPLRAPRSAHSRCGGRRAGRAHHCG